MYNSLLAYPLYTLLGTVNFKIMIDFSKVTENEEVVELLKQREDIERKINQLDEKALINYELERLQED